MTRSIALIGAGGIAQDHAAAYARIPGARVSHVMDTDADRAQSLAARIGAAWSTDAAAVFAAPDVDAVDICTPSETHAALTIAAAERGKAIHVEKPAALSLADFDAMVAATERHGVSLMVGQTARFQPVNAEIAREIAAGTIGRLRVLHVTWYAGHVWADGWRAWQLDPARSGGHPLHNGIHALDLAVWLFGRQPTRVFSRGFRTFAPTMGIPDSFHMTVRFDDGSMALLEIAYALHTRGDALRRILAVGEHGSLQPQHGGRPAGVQRGRSHRLAVGRGRDVLSTAPLGRDAARRGGADREDDGGARRTGGRARRASLVGERRGGRDRGGAA